MVFRISAVGATTQGAAAPPAGDGRGIYVVKKGQSIYSIAREFGMKPEEFQKWAGLKSTNLSVGQEIKLPTATVPDGKGIFALAKKYNMPIEDFCKINGITKSYQAKKGEKFYVKKDGLDSSKSTNATSSSSYLLLQKLHLLNLQNQVLNLIFQQQIKIKNILVIVQQLGN